MKEKKSSCEKDFISAPTTLTTSVPASILASVTASISASTAALVPKAERVLAAVKDKESGQNGFVLPSSNKNMDSQKVGLDEMKAEKIALVANIMEKTSTSSIVGKLKLLSNADMPQQAETGNEITSTPVKINKIAATGPLDGHLDSVGGTGSKLRKCEKLLTDTHPHPM